MLEPVHMSAYGEIKITVDLLVRQHSPHAGVVSHEVYRKVLEDNVPTETQGPELMDYTFTAQSFLQVVCESSVVNPMSVHDGKLYYIHHTTYRNNLYTTNQLMTVLTIIVRAYM